MNSQLPTVLVVEDEKSLLKAWVDRFRREGLNVLAARDGGGALSLALDFHPDLVVVDLVMPSSDGLTLIKKLREDKWGSRVPVMFLSGWLNPELAGGRGWERAEADGSQLNNHWSFDQVIWNVRQKLKFKQPAKV